MGKSHLFVVDATSLKRRLASVVAGVAVAAMMIGCAAASSATAQAEEAIPSVGAETNLSGRHFMVYYRAWRDVTMKGVNTDLPDDNWISMYDIPYGIDVVNVFSYVPSGQEEQAKPFYDKLKSDYAPYLHSRGIKLVRGLDYTGVMVNGFKKWIAGQGKTVDTATDADYGAYADSIIEEYMTSIGLDGLDIDMETYPSADEIAISNKVIMALSKRIGPRSDDPEGTMFLYDTNGSTMGPFKDVADCFDYVAYQQYGSDSTRTAKAAADYEQYIPSTKFVPGLTFPEEGDRYNRWYDATEPYAESHIYDVASYSRQNNLGGMFLYALDRDGRTYDEDDLTHIKPSNLIWTKTAIAENQGMMLDEAKAAANHFLDRMSRVQTVDQSVRDAVASGATLYDVNKAVLGADYGEGFSNTYDPTLERQLVGIDIDGINDAIDQADRLIADSTIDAENRTALQAARDAAVTGLTGKLYTADQVAQWNAALAAAIEATTAQPEPEDPQPNPETKPEDGIRPQQPNAPTTNKHPQLANTGADTAVTASVAGLLALAGVTVLAVLRRRVVR